jgi:hypothetical protein
MCLRKKDNIIVGITRKEKRIRKWGEGGERTKKLAEGQETEKEERGLCDWNTWRGVGVELGEKNPWWWWVKWQKKVSCAVKENTEVWLKNVKIEEEKVKQGRKRENKTGE